MLKQYQLITEDTNKIELTPKGAFFADEVVQQFYEKNYIPFPKPEYCDGKLNPYN